MMHNLSDDEIDQIDDQTYFHESCDWNRRFARNILKAAQSIDWVELKPEMYDSLEGKYWLALKTGNVVSGEYEWKQGWHPHGFNGEHVGRYNVTEVAYIMPYSEPIHPDKRIE